MMGYLQSQDRLVDRLSIGPGELQLAVASDADVKHLARVGVFSLIAGRRTLFYRWNGRLRLRLGEDAPIELENSQAHWDCSGDQATFILRRSGTRILYERYSVSPDVLSIGDDPTPFAEAEDFDLFLLVRNVLADPARAARIFRNVDSPGPTR